MGFLTGRIVMWLVVGGTGLTILATLYFGGISKGVAMRDALWRNATTERIEDVRNVNFDINRTTLERDRVRAAREAEINDRWEQYPTAPKPKIVSEGDLATGDK